MSIESEIIAQYVGSAVAEEHLDKFAEQIRDEVRERTPVFGDHDPKRNAPGIGEPGDLKASVVVDPIKKPGHRRVISEDGKVYWAELGAKHFPEVGMFAQVAALHGGTGPVVTRGDDTAIQHEQKKYRHATEKLAKAIAEGEAVSIASAKVEHALATGRRTAAFNAARPRQRGRSR